MTKQRVKTYWLIWYTTASNALQQTFISPWTNALFFFGKSIRFAMMILFLLVLKQSGAAMAGYTADQVVVFFLTYQILDVSTQVLFRGVYMFSPLIREGRFDGYLSKPVSPLFRALMGHPDINDALFLFPVIGVSLWIVTQLEIAVTLTSIVLYLLLLLNGYLIALGMHILVMAAGILITEVDGIIWLYRDLLRLGQFPITAYHEPLRSFLYFAVPIALMITIPADALLGSSSWQTITFTLVAGILFLGISVLAWRQALKHYSSAGG